MSIISYYVSGNTSDGFQNLLATNVDSLKRKIFLNHPSLTLKTFLLQEVVETYEDTSDLEVILSSWGKPYIEGVIIRDESLAVIDGRLDTGYFPDAVRLDLQAALKEEDSTIAGFSDVKEQINKRTEKANRKLHTALKIHDELEAIYIQEMDFKKADRIMEQLIAEEVNGIPDETTPSHVYHRMFGANAPGKSVSVVSELMDPVSKRYILKGRAGTGKSVFMKRVANACEAKGIDIELYHCSFDPASIDMILVRNDFCIVDGTPPHEVSPSRKTDVVIDLYEQTVAPGTDEKYAQQIGKISGESKVHTKEASALFKQTSNMQAEQEAYYSQTLTAEKKNKAMEHLKALMV